MLRPADQQASSRGDHKRMQEDKERRSEEEEAGPVSLDAGTLPGVATKPEGNTFKN